MLWTDGFVSFLLAKAALAYLPTALSVGLRPLFLFSRPKCSSFSAEACAILQALCWSRQHQQVYHFSSILLSDSCFVLATLSSPPPFLLPQTLWQIWQELYSLPSCYIKLQWVPAHLFLPGNDAADELARRELLLVPSVTPCSLSRLFSRIHFSWTGGIPTHLNSLTHRFRQFPPRNLCSLVTLAVFSLVYAATDTA